MQRRPRALSSRRDNAFRYGFEHQRLPVRVAGEQTMLGRTRRVDDEPRRVRIADEIVDVDPARLEQFVNHRQDQKAVRARPDADPVVGNRRITGAHRVDRDEARAVRLDPGNAHLDRVGIVVFRDAEQHEQLRAFPVRRTELPEGPAECHDASGGHVDRAEAAMSSIVGRPELLRPETRERLRLVPPGKEGEPLGVVAPHRVEPLGRQRKRLLPGDFPEFAGTPRPGPQQRRLEPRRRVMLHDAGRALRAQNAAIDRVIPVALDVADPAVLEMHVDAATARAHIAGRLSDLVANRLGQRDTRRWSHSAIPSRRVLWKTRRKRNASNSTCRGKSFYRRRLTCNVMPSRAAISRPR